MKSQPIFLRAGFAVVAGTLAFGAAHADTLINIKGFGADGAGVDDAYSLSLPPGTIIGMVNPVFVELKAGDYAISDAWGRPGALYDAWNYQLAAFGTWDSHFYAAVRQGSSASYSLLLDGLALRDPACTNPNCSWSTEALAAAAFLRTPAFGLRLAQDTTVAFSSTDYDLLDNAGGMSLRISAVPEPSAWMLWLAALPWWHAAMARLRRCNR